MIDWTPVTTALVALIATVITTFIPMGIRFAFEAWAAKMAAVKDFKEKNQAIVSAIVMVIQQSLNALTGAEKYHEALARASEALHLPDQTLHDMIELAVATFKLEWGEEWDIIGGAEEEGTLKNSVGSAPRSAGAESTEGMG
jgi:hypothetical protein